ncbi:MAG: TraB/GumN family protein, partial [Asticcacaulis sp.]
MFRAVLIGLCLLMAAPAFAQTKAETGAETTNPDADWNIDEVTVVRSSTGPALWRVVKDDHVVWIIGFAEIKRGTKWNSARIDRIVSGAQRLYLPPAIVYASTPHALTALPEGQTLRDVVSPEDYARVEALIKTHHLNRSLILRSQPFWAGQTLNAELIGRTGLTDKGVIERLRVVAE